MFETQRNEISLLVQKEKKLSADFHAEISRNNRNAVQCTGLHWMLNVNANILNFRFDFVGGQNTKIHPKYQNSFQAQNAKISAVSTPILTGKAAFFSIFRALSEKSVENE